MRQVRHVCDRRRALLPTVWGRPGGDKVHFVQRRCSARSEILSWLRQAHGSLNTKGRPLWREVPRAPARCYAVEDFNLPTMSVS